MNNIKTRNRLFTLLLLVIALLIPQWGWAQTASQPSVGNGSTRNPYEISTAAELAWFRDYVNGGKLSVCAKLTADIDLKDFCHAADASKEELSWEPIGNYSNKYTGTFDGNGHTISNLYIKVQRQGVGFFGCASGGSIKNITFDNAQVENTGNDYNYSMTGIVVGATFGTLQNLKTLKNCSVKSGAKTLGGIAGTITGSCSNLENNATVSGRNKVGGIAGSFSGSTLSSCVNNGMVKEDRSGECGGIVGYIAYGTIEDCANYGNVTGTNEIGGIVGYAQNNSTIKSTLSIGDITSEESRAGIIVGYARSINASNMLAYSNNAKLTINGTKQEGDNFKTVGEGNLGIASGSTLDEIIKGFTQEQLKSGVVAYLLQQNASTKAKWGQNLAKDGDIYPVIGSEYQVYADNVTYNCKTKEVVECSSTFNNISSVIKYKHGKIDHHAAINATCTEAGTKAYWQCQDCKRTYSDQQLNEELTDVTQPALGHINNADGYCSRCQPYGVKPSAENGVYQIAKPYHLAWFRNYVNGTIVNDGEAAGTAHPSESAKLTADIDLKGYCYAADKTQSLNELSWVPIGNINNAYKGTFDGNGKTISNLYINASQENMGLFGYILDSTIKNLTLEDANVTNMSNYTGILVGKTFAENTLQNIKISGTCEVNGGDYTGGIAGEHGGKAYNCVNHATVQGTETVGGLFGRYYSGNFVTSITACANYGKVTATKTNVGGLVGLNENGTIQDCANYGNVTSTVRKVGGLVGDFKMGTIQDCANYGDVKGAYQVGGMVGYATDGMIRNVFCYGSIDATLYTYSGIAIGYLGNLYTSGMVAYYSGAKLTGGGEEFSIKAIGTRNKEYLATGFTEAQLKSGEVAWRLNGYTSVPAEGETLAWYQKLGEKGDKYPVLTPGSGNTVYNNYCTCVDNQVNIYSNTEADTHEKYDKHVKGIETLLENGLYSYTCQRCQTNLVYIKDFCGTAGNDLELTATDGNYKAKTVTLTDKAAYNSPVDFTADEVEYTRNNPHTEWQVYYVPFDIDCGVLSDAGITAAYINNFHEYTKNGETEVVLEVNEVTSGTLKANVPYVIKAAQSGNTQIQTSNVTLHKAESNTINCQSVTHDYTITGIYKEQSGFNQDENVTNGIFDYTLKGGLFYELIKTATLSPMRWYLTISNRNKATETPSAQPARVKSVTIKVVGEGEATGIENIHVITEGNAYVNQGIYDLQGRRLSAEPAHGIYIKNGKKYVK